MSLPTFNISHRPFYKPKVGYLGRYNIFGGMDWHRCREVFHSYVDNAYRTKTYYLITNNPEAVAGLVKSVENILGVEPTQFAVHWGYQDSNALRIQPSGFWLVQPMRHQFFTCVLKAGLAFDHVKNPLKTLKEFPYLGQSWDAVDKFLSGESWYTGDIVGWHKAFSKYEYTNGVPNQHPTWDKHIDIDRLVKPNDDHVKGRSYYVWEDWQKPMGREGDIWYQSQKDCGTVRV